MADLRDRFRIAQQIPAPDLWPDIQERLASTDREHPPALRPTVSAGGPLRRDPVRKWLTIAAAIAIAVPAIAFAVHAFHSTGSEGVENEQPSGVFDQVHGWIAYAGSGNIMAVDPADPARSYQLTDHDGINNPLAWSRDGSTMLVRRGVCCGYRHSLFLIRSDGSRMRLTLRGANFGASFSPDGSIVVYGSRTRLGGIGYVQSLYLVDTSGGPPTLLAKGGPHGTGYAFPAWSPDGSTIAYVASSKGAKHSSISLMSPDGTNRHVLLSSSELGTGGFYDPMWSPDGSRLAFGVQTTKSGSAVWVVDADGTGLAELSTDGWFPSWSPDGTRIAFVTHRGGLFTVDADGGDIRQILLETPIIPYSVIAWNPVPPG